MVDREKQKTVPLISVIIPTYQNKLVYLKLAIGSILNQSFGDFEVLLIDDGNTDECLAYMLTIEKQDERVHLIRNNQKNGLAAALNKGLSMARGKYIARMDADDISISDRFQKQIDFLLKHAEVDVLGSTMDVIDGNGEFVEHIEMNQGHEEIKAQAYLSCPVMHPSVMFQKESILSIGGYNPDFKMAEDYELWLRALRRGLIFHNLQEPLLCYRIEKESFERRGRKVYLYDAKARWKNFRLNEDCVKMIMFHFGLYLASDMPKPCFFIMRQCWRSMRWVKRHIF